MEAVNQYRRCVAIILIKQELILACERNDIRGAWQIPQGGVNANEAPLNAAKRELFEETNITSVEFIKHSSKSYSYNFIQDTPEYDGFKYVGQDVEFFVFKFIGFDSEINLSTHHAEFINWKWMSPHELSDNIIDFKKKAYIAALKDLQLL